MGALQCGVVATAALEWIVDGVERPPDHERDAARVVVDIGAVEHVAILSLVAGAHATVERIIEVGAQGESVAKQAGHHAQVQSHP